MKRSLRQGLLVSGTAFILAAAAFIPWTALGDRPNSDPRAPAESTNLAAELRRGDDDAHHEQGGGHLLAPGETLGRIPAPDDADRTGKAGGQVQPDSLFDRSSTPQSGEVPATTRYGPFVLPPAPLGEHLNLVLSDVPKPCEDCFLTSLRPDLVYSDGRSANLDSGVMLHHAVWFQTGKPDMTCGPGTVIGRVGQRFFATGNERTSGKFVPGFGYYVGDSNWALIVELMNHTRSPKTVNLQLEVTWRPNSPDMKPLTPVWLDVDNCGDSEYSAPRGPSRTRWQWTSSIQGRVISAAGHLHDGGTKAVLTNLTTAEDVCVSVAGYGHDPAYRGSLEAMSTCNWDTIGTVRTGDVLALDSYYELSRPRDDVMGIMLTYLYETTDLAGGTPPPREASPEPHPSPRPHEH